MNDRSYVRYESKLATVAGDNSVHSRYTSLFPINLGIMTWGLYCSMALTY